MKSQFIEGLEEGDGVDSRFSVKYKKPPKEYKNGFMFVLGLADRTGEIEVKFWGGEDERKVKELFESISPGDVLHVEGKASVFQNRLQINVEEGDLEKTRDYDIEDFVERTDRDPDEMFRELKGKYEDLNNIYMRKLMNAFFDDEEFVENFKEAPAAMYYHHAHLGGLLEHTLDMLDLAETVHSVHSKLDLDLLKVGCFVHDIGKVREFEVTTNIKQSRGGLLTGHIPFGQQIVLEKTGEVKDFPENLMHKLLHIISSHHGDKENGAVKEPMFPEALAVHYLDDLDSQLIQLIEAKESADTEDFHIWKKRFGQIYLE